MRHIAIPLMMAAMLAVAVSSCRSGHPFLAGADALRELNTGKSLMPRKARRADAIYGTVQRPLFGSEQSVAFVRFRPGRYTLAVVSAEAQEADSCSALSRRRGALAGINGSFFDMGQLTNVTYIKADGQLRGNVSPGHLAQTNGAVMVSRTGDIRIDATDDARLDEGDWRDVMASRPILIDEGTAATYDETTPEWEGFYQKRHPRSLIGQDAKGYVWMVVVDGRLEGRAAGMSIAELTELSRMMGLTDALNLDGGGSSALWTLPGDIISHPSDNGRFDHAGQRPVPNILVVLPAR